MARNTKQNYVVSRFRRTFSAFTKILLAYHFYSCYTVLHFYQYTYNPDQDIRFGCTPEGAWNFLRIFPIADDLICFSPCDWAHSFGIVLPLLLRRLLADRSHFPQTTNALMRISKIPLGGISILLIFLLAINVVAGKRRTSGRNWQFEARPGMGNLVLEAEEEEGESSGDEEKGGEEEGDGKEEDVEGGGEGGGMTKAKSAAEGATTMAQSMEEKEEKELRGNEIAGDEIGREREEAKAELEVKSDEEKAKEIIEKAVNMTDEEQMLPFDNDEIWRNLSLLPEVKGKKVFWVDATFKAVDLGMNFSELAECATWRRYWSAKKEGNDTEKMFQMVKAENRTDEGEEGEESNELVEYEIVEDGGRLEELIPSSMADELLEIEDYEAVGILFEEVCGEHERDFFYKSPEDAKAIGIGNGSIICEPFRRELHPEVEQLAKLEREMNGMVGWNETEGEGEEGGKKEGERRGKRESEEEEEMKLEEGEEKKEEEEERKKKSNWSGRKKQKEGESGENARRRRREGEEEKSEEKIVKTEEEMEETIRNKTESAADAKPKKPVEVDVSDETSPLLIFSTESVASSLGLRIAPRLFQRHQRVGLFLPGICSDYVPKAIEAFNASDFEGVEIEGPIGVNISALESAGVNLTELAEKLRNDTEVDEILGRTKDTARALGGSYILPVLNKNQYDPFSPPIVFQGSAVVVRFGIYIESMSNFQTSTMDYDMDIYLIMGWRDPRLVNTFTKPILVKEEEILEKIWRPDPFFDAKEAEFHEVTFLNFLMRIFNDGLILYETRIKLKPACNLILCKYPHDKQTCELQIKSFAYPAETVRFEWFTNRKDAIDKNPDVRLPELYIDNYEPTKCNRSRKSGEFACLRAVFRLKRDVGFHIAQTYIPTSLALMFSWVGVWLPEEFMEGRIGVAITVLLTLSTESAGAREHLPSVSYLKAIDLWFGYITGFVFFTLLQTLFVIGFDKRANQLRKWATKKRRGTLELSREAREEMSERADRYHKIGRYLDNCCRVFYPLSFSLFLILYYFVLTEGQQDDCIADRH